MKNKLWFYYSLTMLMVLVMPLSMPLHGATNVNSFIVVNTNDSGLGSLRWAVEQANNSNGKSIIKFELTGSDVIVVDTSIVIKKATIIDGQITGDGKIKIMPKEESPFFPLFRASASSVATDTLLLRNIDYDGNFKLDMFYIVSEDQSHQNCFVMVDSTVLYTKIENCMTSNVVCVASSTDGKNNFIMQDCQCDSVIYSVFSTGWMNRVSTNVYPIESVEITGSKFKNFDRNTSFGCVIFADCRIPFAKVYDCDFENTGNLFSKINNFSMKRCHVDSVRKVYYNTALTGPNANGERCKLSIEDCVIKNTGDKAVDCSYIANCDINIVRDTFFDEREILEKEKDRPTIYLNRNKADDKGSYVKIADNIFGSEKGSFRGVCVNADRVEVTGNQFFHGEGVNFVDKGMKTPPFLNNGSDSVYISGNYFGLRKNPQTDIETNQLDSTLKNKCGAIMIKPNSLALRHKWDDNGEIPSFWNSYTKIENNIFAQTDSCDAIFFTDINRGIGKTNFKAEITRNLFFSTQDTFKAIRNALPIAVPQITSVSTTKDRNAIVVEVETPTTTDPARIELFYTSGQPQTAEAFIAEKNTNNGKCTFTVDKSDLHKYDELCFVATATYDGLFKETSDLSDVACLKVDTIYSDTSDIAIVGANYQYGDLTIDGSAIEKVGVLDTIVVWRELWVLHIDTLHLNVQNSVEFFVRPESVGRGDGSDWENAMSGKTFSQVVKYENGQPQITSFFLAEGKYNEFLELKRSSYIKGGFPSNVTGQDTISANPKKYRTLIKEGVEIGEGAKDTIQSYCLWGLTFEGATEGTAIQTMHNNIKKLNIIKSIFIGNRTAVVATANSSCWVKINECIFNENSKAVDFCDNPVSSNVEIKNSTFEKNVHAIYGSGKCSRVRLLNNTFFGNDSNYYEGKGRIGDLTRFEIINNTFGGGFFRLNPSDLNSYYFNGNLIGFKWIGQQDVYQNYSVKLRQNIVLDVNFFKDIQKNPSAKIDIDSATNLQVDSLTFVKLFADRLADNGGFTPTLALLTDTLPDGRSLRFPLTETIVTEDQRGWTRFQNTAMGAFEPHIIEIKNISATDTLKCFGERASASFTVVGYKPVDTVRVDGTMILPLPSFSSTGNDTSFFRVTDLGGGVHHITVNTDELVDSFTVVAPEPMVSVDELTPLVIDEIRQSALCFNGTLAKLTIAYSNNVLKQQVTCLLTDIPTGKLVRSATSKLSSDQLVMEHVPMGKYVIQLRYGSEECKMDGNTSVEREFEMTENSETLSIQEPIIIPSTCVSSPNGTVEFIVRGWDEYHAYWDDEEILPADVRGTVAWFRITGLSGGNHTLTVKDDCGGERSVKITEEDMPILDTPVTMIPQTNSIYNVCYGEKNGEIALLTQGGTSKGILTMNDETRLNMDTRVEVTGLGKGFYRFRYESPDENCVGDAVEVMAEIIGVEHPLSLDVVVNGTACVDNVAEVHVSGENGEYGYTWVYPDGTKQKGDSVLKNAGVGLYVCEVTNDCSTLSETVEIGPASDLSRLQLNDVRQSALCFDESAAKLIISYSNESPKQAVTCRLTERTTGKLVASVTSKSESGDMIVEDVPVGSYSMKLYYGSADCIMDEENIIEKEIEVTVNAEKLNIQNPIITPSNCVSAPNGSVEINVTGWDDYHAYWDEEEVFPNNVLKTTAQFLMQNLVGGRHTFTLRDDCGGERSVEITDKEMPKVDTPVTFKAYADGSMNKCSNDTKGILELIVKGDPNNGMWTMNGGQINMDYPFRFFNMPKGKYTFKYESLDKSCQGDDVEDIAVVSGPSELQIKFNLKDEDCETATLQTIVMGEELSAGSFTYIWKKNGKNFNVSDTLIPFAVQAKDVYTLEVQTPCTTKTEQFRIPSVDDFSPLDVKLYPYTERCHNGNNGSIDVRVNNKDRNLPAGTYVTVTAEKDDVKLVKDCRIDSLTDCWVWMDPLEPGNYEVSVRYGTKDCDKGNTTISSTTTVDALSQLKFEDNTTVVGQSCKSTPNGSLAFTVDGWSFTHTVTLQKISSGKVSQWKGEALMSEEDLNHKGTVTKEKIKLDNLSAGIYRLTVKDKCGNSIDTLIEVKDFTSPQCTLEEVQNLTCLSEPNGGFSLKISPYDTTYTFYLSDKKIERDEFQLTMTENCGIFKIDSIKAGKWKFEIKNGCGESLAILPIEVKGIAPYKIRLDELNSRTFLPCSYSENGIINVITEGGTANAIFKASAVRNVTEIVEKKEKRNQLHWKTVDVKVEKRDSAHPIVSYDTIFSGKDTVINEYVMYNPLRDEQGNVVYEIVKKKKQVNSEVEVKVSEYVTREEEDDLEEYLGKIKDSVTGSVNKYNLEDRATGRYRFVYRSSDENCPNDKTMLDVEVTSQSPIYFVSQTLDIACQNDQDGVISVKPIRGSRTLGESTPEFVVSHDKKDRYDESRVFLYNDDYKNTVGRLPEYKFEPYKVNGKQEKIAINELFHTGENNTLSWSKLNERGVWSPMMIVLPVSSDSTEEHYFSDKGGKDTITSPVYSNFALEDFWIDDKGVYVYPNVQNIANLPTGYYKVDYNDEYGCVYSDSFEIRSAKNALKIDKIEYDAELAHCEPTKRQIKAYVSGGWGNYNYSFTDFSESESNGALEDGYRGGEAQYYDSVSNKGWGLSEFLLPGHYNVVVIDGNGCMVKSDGTYDVTSDFVMKDAQTMVRCANDTLTPVKLFFDGMKPTEEVTCDIDEYMTKCDEEDLACADATFLKKTTDVIPKEEEDASYLKISLSTKTHGLFIYPKINGVRGCGTYVKATILDTLHPMTISKDTIVNTTCFERKDGEISLLIAGGTHPYSVIRNSGYGKNDTVAINESIYYVQNAQMQQRAVSRPKYSDKLDEEGNLIKDGEITVTYNYLPIRDLESGSYYFTVEDAKGCRTVMGSPETYDTSLVVKEPNPLVSHFSSSLACIDFKDSMSYKEAGELMTKGGAVYYQLTEGGTRPYTYYVDYQKSEDYGGGMERDSSLLSRIVFPDNWEGDRDKEMKMYVKDANGCVSKEEMVSLQHTDYIVDKVDFWATTWRHKGDVIALIDVCYPDYLLDSVSYEFLDAEGNIDPHIEKLDKRMYIYDVDNGTEMAKNFVKQKNLRREPISDTYFKDHFNLIVDDTLAKHINFVKMKSTAEEDATAEWSKETTDSLWKQHYVRMNAFYGGCQYRMEKSDTLKVAYDSYDYDNGGVNQREEILEFNVDYTNNEIRVVLSSRSKDAKITFYQMNGSEGSSHKLNEIAEKMEVYEGEVTYVITLSKMKGAETEAGVLLLTTRYDMQAKKIVKR